MSHRAIQPLFASFFGSLVLLSGICALGTDDVVRANRKIEPFPMERVRLLPSPFKTAQDKNSEYLLSVEPDRLLAKLRTNSGLEPKAEQYGGWESQSIMGHSLGHYLSALSKTYASTGDERFKERADYVVSELAECQKKYGTGMLPLYEKYPEVFGEIERGDVRTQGFDLNGLWVPWYAIHKVFAGLLDAHLYCDNEDALEVAKGLGDWGISVIDHLSFELMQKMLLSEYGGTNDAYYNLYAATGDEKYLKAGDRFYDLPILKPLSEARDELRGRHGNTQIPKIIGLARRYELAGNGEINAFPTADFFWKRVVGFHTYAIGGNTMGEHFGEPGVLSTRLNDATCETCNTYNMLKLTKELYEQSGDVAYIDYFERALYNHILASIDKTDDKNKLYAYFVPLRSGGFRTYSTPETHWTCCHGTGMENHAQYNGHIYYRQATDEGETLYVNLLVPSTLDWRERGLAITLDGNGALTVDAKERTEVPIKVRVPNNCRSASLPELPDGYLQVGDVWEKGETTIQLSLVADWKIEPTPDNENVAAFFRGPVMYAGYIGPSEAPVATQLEAETEEAPKNAAIVPVVVSDDRDVETLLGKGALDKDSLFEEPDKVVLKNAKPGDVPLAPFYKIDGRYVVYFDFFDSKSWSEKEKEISLEKARLNKLAESTLSFFQPGEMQPERDANFSGEKTFFGEHMGRKWRDARDGGYFEFDMKVDPEKPCALVVTYWGDETGNRVFDLLIDGDKIAERRLNRDKPGKFFDELYSIPNQEKKSVVRVRFQGKENATAGGIFGARTIYEDAREELYGEQ